MKFSHHCKDFQFDPDRSYSQGVSMKPRGLWLSVDDDWRRWCEAEEMGHWVEGDEVEFDVDMSRVLHLGDVEAIDQFHQTYVTKHCPEWRPGSLDFYRINWEPLSERFAGIAIAPYQWQRRLDGETTWYYTWDAASACIWDLSVIKLKVNHESIS